MLIFPDRLAPESSDVINPLPTVCFLASLASLFGALPALAADRWEEAGSGAVAILPLPKPATAITGGSFYCSEQRWAFLLRTASDTAIATGEKAKISIGNDVFEADAAISSGAIKIAVRVAAVGGDEARLRDRHGRRRAEGDIGPVLVQAGD